MNAIYDGNVKIGSYNDQKIIILPYDIYLWSHNFALITINGKLCYNFNIERKGVCKYYESGYDIPDINDIESIIELSHLLRYKYDVILNTVFDNTPLPLCPVFGENVYSAARIADFSFGYNVINKKVNIIETNVIINESIIKHTSRYIGCPVIEYISDSDYTIVINNVIYTFITAKPNSCKKAT